MATKKKIKRYIEKGVLKARIDELLSLLGISRQKWKKLDIRVEGIGVDAIIHKKYFKFNEKAKWGRHKKGHKPSLKSQFSVLWDLWQEKIKNQKMLDEFKEQLDSANPEKGEIK